MAGSMREEAKRGHNTLGKHKQPAGTLQTLLQRAVLKMQPPITHRALYPPSQPAVSASTSQTTPMPCFNLQPPHPSLSPPALTQNDVAGLHSRIQRCSHTCSTLTSIPPHPSIPPPPLTRYNVACVHSRIQRRSHHSHCCRRRRHRPRCRRALTGTAVTGVAALPVRVGQAARHRAGLIKVSRAATKRGIAQAWHALQVVVHVALPCKGREVGGQQVMSSKLLPTTMAAKMWAMRCEKPGSCKSAICGLC